MNSNGKIDTQFIGEALKILRKKVEAVLKDAPNLRGIDSLDKLPKEKVEVVKDQLWSIFAYGEYPIEKMMADLSESESALSITNTEIEEEFKYYRNTYKKFNKKIIKLIDAKPMDRGDVEKTIEFVMNDYKRKRLVEGIYRSCHINECMKEYKDLVLNGWLKGYIKYFSHASHSSIRPDNIKSSFVEIIESADDKVQQMLKTNPDAELYYPGHEDDEDTYEWLHLQTSFKGEEPQEMLGPALVDCIKIISKPYFKPDNWIENQRTLSLITVTEEIPTHVKERLNEIRLSFIFGNYMSVIALSRSLLEYALIHRGMHTGSLLKEHLNHNPIHDDNGKEVGWENKNIGISKRASIAKKVFPKLEKSMRSVITLGNFVMHPFSKTIPRKYHAKLCIGQISKIINTLYSQWYTRRKTPLKPLEK